MKLRLRISHWLPANEDLGPVRRTCATFVFIFPAACSADAREDETRTTKNIGLPPKRIRQQIGQNMRPIEPWLRSLSPRTTEL